MYIYDILTSPNISTGIYDDDTDISSTFRNCDDINNQLQRALNPITDHLQQCN